MGVFDPVFHSEAPALQPSSPAPALGQVGNYDVQQQAKPPSSPSSTSPQQQAENPAPQKPGPNAVGVAASALEGSTGGAALGTSIMPGVGTAVGAVVGAIGGLVKGIFSDIRVKTQVQPASKDIVAFMDAINDQKRRI